MTRMLMSGLPRRVLVLIVDEGTIEARDGRMSSVIAGMLQVRQDRVTAALHRLDAQGLIERRHVPLTGRTFSVRATAAGRAALNREGHVGAVVRRAARVEVAAPMPCPGPIGHLSFDAERVRALSGGGVVTATYLIGDVFDVLATLEDGSVDLVLTSPPFLALRSYLPTDHPDKGKEIGTEPTPAAFLDTLLHLTAEWRRVLAPHGSICVELGDTYSGSGGAGGDWIEGSGQRVYKRGSVVPDFAAMPQRKGDGWPMDKSLAGIPHLYHLSLAYGRNLLTGQPSPAGQWRVRNVVAWCRPNPPVGALGDKFRPATSYMTIATVARDRYFDLDAVRAEPSAWTKHYAENPYPESARAAGEAAKTGPRSGGSAVAGDAAGKPIKLQGAPPLDWWEIPTQPYSGAHYATWPMALCTRPIRSMCPPKVCTVCGEPSRRIVDSQRTVDGLPLTDPAEVDWSAQRKGSTAIGFDRNRVGTERTTLGWTDCGHDAYRTGVVLDPFGGSGTTGAVATGEGRDAILIDLDARNAELARERIGMFLDIDYGSTEGAA